MAEEASHARTPCAHTYLLLLDRQNYNIHSEKPTFFPTNYHIFSHFPLPSLLFPLFVSPSAPSSPTISPSMSASLVRRFLVEMQPPVERISGSTSPVTQCLNAFASSSLPERMSESACRPR